VLARVDRIAGGGGAAATESRGDNAKDEKKDTGIKSIAPHR
jgi:hypothetical protein